MSNLEASSGGTRGGREAIDPPGFAEIFAARAVLEEHFDPTPLVYSDALSCELDAAVYLKRDDVLPTGAFKIRGGLTLAAALREADDVETLVTASTGNHGQSIAYAGRELGVPVEVVVPEDANEGKVEAMERLDATVVAHGASMDEAFAWARERAGRAGRRFVHPANEPRLIAGVATAGLEVLEQCPAVDTIVSPVGGGSYASGFCLTAGQLVDADVIGVQSTGANAAYRAYHTGRMASLDSVDTFAEGIAVGTPFELTTRILREHLAEFVQLEDDAFRRGIETLLRREHLLAEAAGVASVAGAYALAEQLGETVVLPVCGRNLDPEKLVEVLAG